MAWLAAVVFLIACIISTTIVINSEWSVETKAIYAGCMLFAAFMLPLIFSITIDVSMSK